MLTDLMLSLFSNVKIAAKAHLKANLY